MRGEFDAETRIAAARPKRKRRAHGVHVSARLANAPASSDADVTRRASPCPTLDAGLGPHTDDGLDKDAPRRRLERRRRTSGSSIRSPVTPGTLTVNDSSRREPQEG